MGPALWALIQSVHLDLHTPVQDVDTLNFLNRATSEEMGAGITVSTWFMLLRSKLWSLLATDINIQYNKNLARISYASFGNKDADLASFDDSSIAEEHILIGADGSQSPSVA